jgi:hypothetical protein
LRAHSSRAYHTSDPVRVPRPAHSFHASFRPHLTVTPLRFPCPSAPLIPGQRTFTSKHYGMHGTHARPQRERPQRGLSDTAEPQRGRDALEGRVRPTASGAPRPNCALRSLRLDLVCASSPHCPIRPFRFVRAYPAPVTEQRCCGVSCASGLPGRDWRCPHSSAPPGCSAFVFLHQSHGDHD